MVEKLASLFGVHVSAFDYNSTEMPLTYALRASVLTEEDMATISVINKIALNGEFLTSILRKESVKNDD